MERSEAYTLVEMLVVVAMVMILSALAYPNYEGYVIRTRRVEAQVALLEAMQEQERYYSQHNTYLAFSAASSGVDERNFRWWLGSSAPRSAYELSGRACGQQSLQACIQLRAEPGTARVNASFHDPQCGTLTLDSGGLHSASGDGAGCWP